MDSIKLWFMEREAVYSTLALFYRDNLSRGLKILKETDLLEKLSEYEDDIDLSDKAKVISGEMGGNKFNPGYEKELWEDYQRLFVGPGRILAPPWESVYESRDRLIFGKSELSVREFYHQFGLEVNPREAADHLAFELSFMARLCSIKTYDDFQKVLKILASMEKFLKEHLCKWVPAWRNCVNSNAKIGFWIELSNITEAWVMKDLKEIEKIIKNK
ncbi:molecular chaperone [Clostridium sp. MT-14]|uniref:Molecular chaperone TorD family protein n=1 Tax=Clostridium aromativorans TaxID=2836848 RepID=A0ABS8N6E5_9CLOT|nr:molecular chaperone TorD family protein [Clostridium aromativorans]MCC9295362.1 molecular chaperone TorD family protein [Clostridium aromativorans]CAB1247521.1 Chaperone protein TorD [Clostridiaceae bacterium BL-3]